MSGVLSGLRVVEFAGLGPAPFCGMLLADMGADVVRIERPGRAQQLNSTDVLARGRKIVEADLKDAQDHGWVLELIKHADVVIEGFRPGVMERLDLGPERCLAVNPKLVFARMTGWGQFGPLADRAGHDINYIAISGVLHAIGPVNDGPVVPLNLVGDFGGGGMMLAVGILAAVLHARSAGQGQVIDAAMSDGAALLSSMMWGFMAAGQWRHERQANFLDGAAHFYTVYECADQKYLAVGPIEPQFYSAFISACGLQPGDVSELNYRDPQAWAGGKQVLAPLFKQKTRDQWCERFEGLDACVSPVLDWQEAARYPHNVNRRTFIEVDGVTQPAPAPRFERTPSVAKPFAVVADGLAGVLKQWR